MSKLFSIYNKYPQVFVAISDRTDGNMKPSGDYESDKIISTHQDKFFSNLGIPSAKVISLKQVHGENIFFANDLHAGRIIEDKDALITNKKNLFLSIRVADCVPVFIFDPTSGVIGLIHGGWRGLAQNIISKTIQKAKNELNLNPAATIVGIGPAICQNHYEVGEDVAEKFSKFQAEIIKKNNKTFLDLRGVCHKQLIQSGINAENIEINKTCTYESENYFSFRRDKPHIAECMMVVVGNK